MVHVWVAANIPAGATRLRAPVPVPPLQAWLAARGDQPAPVAEGLHEIRVEGAPAFVSSAAASHGPGNGRRSTGEQSRRPQQASIAVDSTRQHLTPAPSEQLYYPARELDVYPVPLAPLRFDYPAQLARAPVAGNVLVTLMVGESGVVDRVAVVAAEPAGYFEEHTRAAFTSARFHPGRRAGRAVGSQITVRVEYDPALGAGLSR